jgi:predicted TIM-barrel fold metal-dependent hydrolase
MTQKSLPIIDVHEHNGPWPFAGKWGGIELNLRLMERRGIDLAIISSTEGIVDDMVAGNQRLADGMAGHQNLFGYVVVNPRYPDLSRRELERHHANPQFVGFKIHTGYSATPPSEPSMADLFTMIEPYHKPLLIHTWGAADVQSLAALSLRFPQLSVIVAHSGGPAWREAIRAAQQVSNLYLDFCASDVERGRIERAVATLGPERVLFGTDSTLFDPLYMLSCFREADIADEHRPLIMGGNALRVFRLER